MSVWPEQEPCELLSVSLAARYKIPPHFFLFDYFLLKVNGKLDQQAFRAEMKRIVK